MPYMEDAIIEKKTSQKQLKKPVPCLRGYPSKFSKPQKFVF